MIVYLVRHAPALKAHEPGCPPDPLRPLTPEGRRKMESAARGMARMGFAPSEILSSPLQRARETAEILGSALGLSVSQLRTVEELKPGASSRAVGELVRGSAAELMLVGHEPDLSRLAVEWSGGAGDSCRIQLRKGACCVLDVDFRAGAGPVGELIALFQPRHLRKLERRQRRSRE